MTSKLPGAKTREMLMVHNAFRREFGLTPALVRGVADGDRQRAETLADHIELTNMRCTTIITPRTRASGRPVGAPPGGDRSSRPHDGSSTTSASRTSAPTWRRR